MKPRYFLIALLWCLLFGQTSYGQIEMQCDTIKLTNGKYVLGLVEKIAERKVFYQICPFRLKPFTKYMPLRYITNLPELRGRLEERPEFNYYLSLNNGKEYLVELLEETPEFVRVKTQFSEESKIAWSEITELTKLREQKLTKKFAWNENHQARRYFITPSGFGLKKGEFYVQSSFAVINQLEYGFTDNFSVGLGIVPLFILESRFDDLKEYTTVWVTPKFSFPIKKNKFNIGGGVILGGLPWFNQRRNYIGMAYGVATIGNKNRNINIGLGMGYLGNEWMNKPMILLSGTWRLSRRNFLIFENCRFDGLPITSIGWRRMWRHISFEYGAIVSFGGFNGPWFGVTFEID